MRLGSLLGIIALLTILGCGSEFSAEPITSAVATSARTPTATPIAVPTATPIAVPTATPIVMPTTTPLVIPTAKLDPTPVIIETIIEIVEVVSVTPTPTPLSGKSLTAPPPTSEPMSTDNTTEESPDIPQEIPAKPSTQRDRPEDKYACAINPDGYCIFSGIPHGSVLKPTTEYIVDRNGAFLFSMHEAVAVNSSGEILQARGTPAFNGDELVRHNTDGMTNDEKAFHRVMAVMFPIRNALMYDIPDINQPKWEALVSELTLREIKDKTFTNGATPRDNYYGRQGVFDLAKNPNGKDIHHDVMKFLEEAGLYLLCHVTSNEFNQMLKDTHPEGHDPCKDAEITSKIPFST